MGNNKGDFRFIKPSQLSFGRLLLNYFKENELITFFHLISSLFIGDVIILFISNDIAVYKYLFSSIQSLSIAILSILIAAFGLFAAITDLNFSKFILKMNQLRNFLFPFWFTSVLWFISIFISMIGYLIILKQSNINMTITFVLNINIYIMTITTGYTLGLIGDILKITITRVQMSLQDNEDLCLELLYNNNKSKNTTESKGYYKFWKIYVALTSLFIIILVTCYFYKNSILIYLSGLISMLWLIVSCRYYNKCKIYNFISIVKYLKIIYKILILTLNFIILFLIIN